jgi:hypothetical protein
MWLLGYGMKQTSAVVEVEPLRLIHEHPDNGPMDTYLRFGPEGTSTRVVVDPDDEMPGKLPGFFKELMARGWVERQTHQMLADFKALAETKAAPLT